jgi:hypothetical protein
MEYTRYFFVIDSSCDCWFCSTIGDWVLEIPTSSFVTNIFYRPIRNIMSIHSTFFRILFIFLLGTLQIKGNSEVSSFREECDASDLPTCVSVDHNATSLFETILADDYEALDDTLPKSIEELKKRGAHRCWHKHSTFLQHLLGVHNILRLWDQNETIGRVGLFHSAYSNSYVNLALFDPNEAKERALMKNLIGSDAEKLVTIFCSIDRQAIVVDTILKNNVIPESGLFAPHLRNKEEKVFLSPKVLYILVIFTMADIADQYFGWQDTLFGGEESINSMLIPIESIDSHESTSIWPGISRPGLWMSYLSQIGSIAQTFASSHVETSGSVTFPVPPVFEKCTHILLRSDEIKARDLYWSVVTGEIRNFDDVILALETSVKYNPWTFEPHVLLAQKYLHVNNFTKGESSATRALQLQLQWGTAWDKRMSFAAWVAWTRVLLQRAQDQQEWPLSSWDVNNFGLVR